MLKSGLDTANAIKNQVNKNLLGFGEKKTDEKKEMEMKENAREGMKFFAQHSAHIEVIRNKNLEKVFFFLPPFCHSLPKEVKVEFNDNVDRVSVQSKITGLFGIADECIEIMKLEERMKIFFGKNRFLALFAQHVELWKDLAFVLTLILNFLIFFSYSEYFGDPNDDEFKARMDNPRLFLDSNAKNTKSLFTILGIIMIICSSFVVAFFLMKKAPLVIQKAWKIDLFNRTNPDGSKKSPGLLGKLVNFLFKAIFTVITILQSVEIVYYILYGLLAVVGLVIHPFFFAFHLTEILLR